MKEIKLFDYQEDMKERIENALRLHRSVMAQMPTDTGKTYLLTAVIDSFVSNNPMEKVWIVAHRRELVSQIDETVRKFHSYSASNTSSLLSSVKAMSIQWLMRHYDEIEEEPGMIVIDEAHHALAKTYKEMWERFPNAKLLRHIDAPAHAKAEACTLGYYNLFHSVTAFAPVLSAMSLHTASMLSSSVRLPVSSSTASAAAISGAALRSVSCSSRFFMSARTSSKESVMPFA